MESQTHSNQQKSHPAGPQHKASDQFQAAGRVLRDSKNDLKSRWEAQVRREVLPSHAVSSPMLLNTVELFLDELVAKLFQGGSHQAELSGEGMSQDHGGQRAKIVGYFLPQLLTEFDILRELIVELFHSNGVLNFEVHVFVDRVINSVISTAAVEFVRVHEASTQEALQLAQSSNRDLEHFATMTAHDLKSPLSTAIGYLSLLSEQSLDQTGQDHLKTMTKILSNMMLLIDRILEYAKLMGNKSSLKPTDLNEVLESTRQNLSAAIRASNCEVHSTPLPIVKGDLALLTRLMQNLISNAIKFCGDQAPKISIASEEKGEMWQISVSDNGAGIDLPDQKNIFTLYQQVSGPAACQGAGIGLATCRRIVELHGGTIGLKSKIGEGSTFYFTLPKVNSSD